MEYKRVRLNFISYGFLHRISVSTEIFWYFPMQLLLRQLLNFKSNFLETSCVLNSSKESFCKSNNLRKEQITNWNSFLNHKTKNLYTNDMIWSAC